MPDDSPSQRQPITRRSFVAATALTGVAANLAGLSQGAEPVADQARQATGTRVGEVTDTSAIVWTRLTSAARRNPEGALTGEEPDRMEGACPPATGKVRLRYSTQKDLTDGRTTEWFEVSPETDSVHAFPLEGLKPATVYHYESETAAAGQPAHAPFRGTFETAPAADAPSKLTFCVMTCQGYPDRGHPDGHVIYPSMLALKPAFTCLTGDLVYYDNDPPKADTPRLARYHWERMFSLPRLVEFTRSVGTYWLKDDHDTLVNDSWPGKKVKDLSFAQGQEIFRQQAPLGAGPAYRTFRWGRDLQIWLTDGRDFRSPNNIKDGPEKTIWGKEQKAWFQKTVSESTATWKVLVSPTPLVGPDRLNKNDNHSNAGFQHEGDEIRAWLKAHVPDNFFVICGDRHWQYHSVHPESGLQEFSVGAASDEHAGGTPGLDDRYHKFHRVKGGFLSVTLEPGQERRTIRFELRDIAGKVVHSVEFHRA
jgi:alkaline phosphatase D